jgi:hypothetical protein
VRAVLDLDETDLSDAVIDVFAREGSNRVEQAAARWPLYEVDYTFTTIDAQSDYLITDIGLGDLRTPERLRSLNHELVWIGADVGDLGWPRTVVTASEPCYWRQWGETIRLYPTPNSAYDIQVRGHRKARDWVSEGAGGEPDLPDELQNLVTVWALARAYAQQEDVELASFYMQNFLSELDVMKARFDGAPLAQPMVLNSGSPNRYAGQALGPGRYDWE